MSPQNTERMNAQIAILEEVSPAAAIFDLDGTILDNNPYHVKAWKQYLEKENRTLTDEEFNEHLNGRTNRDAVKYLYGDGLSEEEIERRIREKESLYRSIYKKHIEPVAGLLGLLDLLQKRDIPMAIATSGIVPNIEFMFEHVPIRRYFPIVIHSGHITQGKPHPEMYLKTASALDIDPAGCLVFEDSTAGIKSAKAAGMKVIALATTHKRKELAEADYITKDFTFGDIEKTS